MNANPEPTRVQFEQIRLSENGAVYVAIPRDYDLVAELPDGTKLIKWQPKDKFINRDADYLEEKDK